ncbi:MAG: chemotaxis-specific protein-glutamate methyltransferase CheB [Sandaracinaceae bacterium]
MTKPIRVLVCDDSQTIHTLMRQVLGTCSDLEISGFAKNGQEAIRSIRASRPDILLLDIEMPVMNGLETLTALRKFDRTLPVICFSTLTREAGPTTLEALERGANDYVGKPKGGESLKASLEMVRGELIPRILALASHGRRPPVRSSQSQKRPIRALAIGASTGGPKVLMDLVQEFPRPFPVPILIAQHMPATMTPVFAKRLGELSGMDSCEGRDGQTLEADKIYLAPGDYHMTISRNRIRLDQSPKVHHCRPAVDVLFHSLAREFGSAVVAAVLTGMGTDGGAGAKAIAEKGGRILAQDRETSTVYGMPRAVVEAGIADKVVPIQNMAKALTECVKQGTKPSATTTARGVRVA